MKSYKLSKFLFALKYGTGLSILPIVHYYIPDTEYFELVITLVWFIKFILNIYILRHAYIVRSEKSSSFTFYNGIKLGITICLISSIIISVNQLFNIFIKISGHNIFSDSISTYWWLAKTAVYKSISTFVYCFAYGILLSVIISPFFKNVTKNYIMQKLS